MPNRISQRIIDLYTAHGRELFPLRQGNKEPLHVGWRKRLYSPRELSGFAKKGYNLGWRLSPLDCVIDIDPRNGGSNSLKKLERDVKSFDLTLEYPSVRTGNKGGIHLYARIPSRMRIRKSLKSYPGIDFLSHGKYVVIPGSLHPNGELYRFDDFSPYKKHSPELPEKLLERLLRRDIDGEDDVEKLSAINLVSTQTLKEVLKQIPVEQYDDNESWFQLMCAAHHCTGGTKKGLNTFLQWSLQDPRYRDEGPNIKLRWQSLKHDADSQITVRTLYREVLRHGGYLPPTASVQDFDSLSSTDIKDIKAKTKHEQRIQLSKVIEVARSFTQHTKSKTIEKLLTNITRLSDLDYEYVLALIRVRTGRPMPALRRTVQALRHRELAESGEIEDVGSYVASKTFLNEYNEQLIYAIDGRFWTYTDTHWKPLPFQTVKGACISQAKKLRKESPQLTQSVISIAQQAFGILEGERSTTDDIFNFTRPTSILNTQSGEIHIDRKTQKIEIKSHEPLSYLTHYLQVKYNPNAKSDLLDQTLDDIFAPETALNRREIIRHLWELIGYSIQPRKDLATWVLLYGVGGNGKTTILDTITGLLGEFVIAKNISDLNAERNAHAFSDLPGKLVIIDDDYTSRQMLPDGALKKVSENKLLTCNPKNQSMFQFVNTAIPWIASNHWPRTIDVSLGLQRRALCFHLKRTFTATEMDPQRRQRIADTEMSGALNHALRGLIRLRKRGMWRIPVPCNTAHHRWMLESNQIKQFITDRVKITGNGHLEKLDDMYAHYAAWTMDEGINVEYSKRGFRRALEESGFASKKRYDGTYEIYGCQTKGEIK